MHAGLHQLRGRRGNAPFTTLPGGVVVGSATRQSKSRSSKIYIIVTIVFFLAVFLAYVYVSKSVAEEQLHVLDDRGIAHSATPPQPHMSKGVDAVVEQLHREAEERRKNGGVVSRPSILKPWMSTKAPRRAPQATHPTTALTPQEVTVEAETTARAAVDVQQTMSPPERAAHKVTRIAEERVDADVPEVPHTTQLPLPPIPAVPTTSTAGTDATNTITPDPTAQQPGVEDGGGHADGKNADPNAASLTTTKTAAPAVDNTPVTAKTTIETVSPPPTTATTDVPDLRTVQPDIYRVNTYTSRQAGAASPEEPERLPNLKLKRRTYTPEELLHRYADTDFVYTFANGSESNHEYRKEVRKACLSQVLRAEHDAYTAADPATFSVHTFDTLQCTLKGSQDNVTAWKTLGDFLRTVEARARIGADNRDRETDELRHSVRSVEQHVRWHKGRVIMVSPGHHPTWVDGAKNFLAGTCGDAAVQSLRSHGTHLRLTTVHQDAVMPYGMRLTADSHVIEQHLWRVRNLTAVHVYMNDDYFVNRDVAITDLFNEYGGTIVRVGSSVLREGVFPRPGASWKNGLLFTQQFNIQELDVKHEDDLPAELVGMWYHQGRVHSAAQSTGALPKLEVARLDDAVDVAHLYSREPLPTTARVSRRPRCYATHAPFVYCTNMFRFFETRYEREFAFNALHHRGRSSHDLFLPFLYNAFVMARPWQASPKFLPYLLELHRSRQQTPTAAPPPVEIQMDNVDACAPASMEAGRTASQCLFGKFEDNIEANAIVVRRIREENPLYFNINAGFKTTEAFHQLRRFLHDKFPTPVYLESKPPAETADPGAADEGAEDDKRTTTTVSPGDAALSSTFERLMALPVVGLVSYEEGSCPLVRSLALAFAEHHRGRVHVLVQRQAAADRADVSLREMRAAVKHRVISAVPAPTCAYNQRVTRDATERGEKLSDMVEHALEGAEDAAVELPSTCGAHGAGVRVRGFVIDARMSETAVLTAATVREALAMPGQTLALEDFRAVPVGPGERDVVLVLSREDALAKAVHWITGAAESDLLLTFPLPVEYYEDMSAPLLWSQD